MSIHATSTEVYSGKNLCPDVAEGYYVTSTSTGWGKTAVDSGVLIAVEPNTNYTISTTATQSRYRFCFVASLDNYTGYNGGVNDGGSHTYTKNSGSYPYLIVNATDLSKIQVEKGSTATPFEPYVGGVPSPLISGVSHVSTSKNLLNMQSDSNGEYLGTMSQHGRTWKNLYTGSPNFSGYGNIGSWEDGGTYNGMPVVKKADSWGGVFKPVDVIAGKTYTFSAWVKSDQARPVAIYATGGSSTATATISPGNEPFTSSTNWERVSFTFTCITSGSVALRIENRDSSTTNYTYISGYQLEIGQEATSYESYLGNGVYNGKNLLNASSAFTVTSSTVYRSIPISIPNGTTVCVQCDSITTNSTTGCSVRFQNSSLQGVGTVILYPGATLSQSVTLIGDAAYCFVYSSNNYASSQSATTTYTNLMVSIGSTAQSYEPYVGGIPSPNPDYPQEIVVGKLKSKNLFAVGKTNGTIADVLYTYNSDGTFSLSGTASAGTGAKSAPIPIAESGLIPGQKYSFWCDHNVGWGSNSCVYYAQSCDSSGNWTGNLMTFTQSGGTATMPSTTTQYVMFVAAISNGSSYSSYNNVKAQLVSGEQVDNVFEPYFTPIELTQIGTKQDKVYKSGNSWYVYRELGDYQLTGSENWQKHQASGAFYDRGNSYASHGGLVPVNNDTLPNIMSTHFVEGAYNEVFVSPAKDGICVATDNTSNPRIHVEGITTVEDFKAMITAKQPVIYFPLATPTNTAITDSATILWLNKYDTDSLPHHKYVNTRRTTYVGASGLASAIDLYDGSYANTLPTYADANDHHLTTANGGTYTVSLQNISAKIVSGTVTFSVFTNQRKIDFSWNGSATITNVSVSLQADEYIKSIYAYIPQNADAGITLSQQLESGSLTDFEPYYNIVKIYAGNDLVFEDTSLTD